MLGIQSAYAAYDQLYGCCKCPGGPDSPEPEGGEGIMGPGCTPPCWWNTHCGYSNIVYTHYVYSGGQVIAEYDNFGALTAKYVYGNGMRLAKVDGSGNKFYLHTDQLGSTRAVTDASKTTVQTFSYYPFGDVLTTSGSNTDYKFNGKEFDEEGGVNLLYYGARYYDPKIGRFISIDPIVNYTNPYSYVRNNPLNLTDPSGMDPIGGLNNYKLYAREGGSPGDVIGRPLGRLGIPNLSLPTGSAEGRGRYVNKLWSATLRMWLLHFAEAGNPGPNLGPSRRNPFDIYFGLLNESANADYISRTRSRLAYEFVRLRQKAKDKGAFSKTNAIDWAVEVADRFGLDPRAVLALMYTENPSLNPNQVVGGHDYGLMGINDDWYGSHAKGTGKSVLGVDITNDLWKTNWADNIVVGAAIFLEEYLVVLGRGMEGVAAYRSAYSAYNSGRDNWDSVLLPISQAAGN